MIITKATAMRCIERGPADASDAGLRGLMSAALRPQSRRIPEDYSRPTEPAGETADRVISPPHPAGMIRERSPECHDQRMTGALMWGLVLPLLLVVAGIVVFLRKRNNRR
ncbi:hypothetical protein [Actinoplanes lobatus]|uniref:Uncharacterized protein n=1 Tax=Actinoplanes lobatus TaxID=113568 RepID=A0A7W7MK45_9ACTN|nr:hypothetical protein [Actinoplanes lobatus]MBB4753362.1 hypothetical protein [Actinoplanes lobatus]